MKKTILSASALAVTLALSGCGGQSSGQDALVECYGVGMAGPGAPLMMTKGMCEKLPNTKIVAVTAEDYVECYAVAAKAENDCATDTSACGGTSTVARDPTAWIAIPSGVCMNLKGSVVGKMAIPPSSKGLSSAKS